MTDFTGEYFDRYHLIAPLGEGGMASVYKAYDTRLERDVAVKIIRTDMFIPAVLEKVMKRFEREAKSLAKLSHPNIVSIIDYGEHAGVPYLVMEYLPGGNLKDRMTGRPLPWQESFHLLLPVARALQFSHQQGIIHRDVKPSNILITLSGEPMLSDFGIARILESEGSTSLTGTGVGIGTPEYMAPEQWVGHTTPQSDLYSLGVVLYEMLTGQKPYTADTPAAILLKQANDPLPRPRQFVPDLPDKVEKVILKLLAKKPENRYSSMEEFITALEDLLRGQTKIRPTIISQEKRALEEVPPHESEIPKAHQPESGTPEVPQPESGIPKAQPLVGEQPTLLVRVPSEAKPAVPVPQETASAKRTIPFPEIPIIETLRRVLKKVHPAWIIALVGLVAVVIFAVWGISQLAVKTPTATVAAEINYFTSDQSGKPEIYYLNSKGVLVQVTYTPDPYGSWSPVPAANETIYFTSDQSGKAEVYYLDSKGKVARVTHTPDPYRSWSPVPAEAGIVYFTSNQSGKAEIYYLDSKGNLVQFTHTPGQYESWSPVPAEGGIVYFTSNQSGKAEIYYLDSKGKLVQFTYAPGRYESWSPALSTSGYVYFASNQSGKTEIHYLDSQGGIHQVTHTPGLYESWSPAPADGGYIYFSSNQSGKAEVYYLNSKGNLIQFTHTPGKYKSWILSSNPDPDIP
jgi:serine/threonine protein kinase/Tol biopolymer transport system component